MSNLDTALLAVGCVLMLIIIYKIALHMFFKAKAKYQLDLIRKLEEEN